MSAAQLVIAQYRPSMVFASFVVSTLGAFVGKTALKDGKVAINSKEAAEAPVPDALRRRPQGQQLRMSQRIAVRFAPVEPAPDDFVGPDDHRPDRHFLLGACCLYASGDRSRARGWVGIAIPEDFGGGGRGITEASIVLLFAIG